MTRHLPTLAALLAASTLVAGCTGSGDEGEARGTGGAGGTGGGEPLECSIVACGGDLVGTWNAHGWCLAESYGDWLPACEDEVVEGDPVVSGTFTFAPDGTFSRATWVGGEFHYEYDDDCALAVTNGSMNAATFCGVLQQGASQPGSQYSGTCVAADGWCVCDLTWGTWTSATGAYGVVAGSFLTLDGTTANEFCVEGNELRLHQADGAVLLFRR